MIMLFERISGEVHYDMFGNEWSEDDTFNPIVLHQNREDLIRWCYKNFNSLQWYGDKLVVTTRKFNGGNPVDITDEYIAVEVEFGAYIDVW